MEDADFMAARGAVLDALVRWAEADDRIAGLWLQGSLARNGRERGGADALSDIDAYVAVRDEAFEAVFAERAARLESLAPVLASSDGSAPGVKMVHALLGGGARLDLVFEVASKVDAVLRPPVRVLVDRDGIAGRLKGGWSAPAPAIGRMIQTIVRMTRQGGTWPLRVLRRGQWSTFAMMELDLINAQVAQLLAVRADPALMFQNAFSLYRRLGEADRAVLDALTADAVAAIAGRDPAAALAAHLKVLDALVREGRAACAALGVDYPISEAGDAALRRLLQEGWPG